MQAYASTVIPAGVDSVWAIVRRFGALDQWHGAIADCAMEHGAPGDQVGAVRAFHLTDGTLVKERLVALDDANRTLTYNFVVPAFPIDNYLAAMHVAPVTDSGRTFVEWMATFDQSAAITEDYSEIISAAVFAVGLEGLARHVGG